MSGFGDWSGNVGVCLVC